MPLASFWSLKVSELLTLEEMSFACEAVKK